MARATTIPTTTAATVVSADRLFYIIAVTLS